MKLYEIEFTKDYGCGTIRSRKIRTHQIPAHGQWDACAFLGQIFNGRGNDDYDLIIHYVKEIKTNDSNVSTRVGDSAHA